MDTKRINWPTVALLGIATFGAVSTLAIVLTLTPSTLLDKLLDLNWPAVATAAMTTAIALYGMVRRAGFLRAESPPAEAPEADDADDGPTEPMGPRAKRRQDTPPAG